MDRLLAPDGCPWDRDQTLDSLRPFLVEETYEVIDALARHDVAGHCEELGDLLMQVVFHAAIRHAEGAFDIDDVVKGISDKLVHRHPHVFANQQGIDTPDQVLAQWDVIKAGEKKLGPAQSSVFKNLPPRLPALMFAEAVWKQIARKKLPAETSVDTAQVSALGGHLTHEVLGRMLFELAAAGQAKGLDPEDALRQHAAKVMRDVEARIQPARA